MKSKDWMFVWEISKKKSKIIKIEASNYNQPLQFAKAKTMNLRTEPAF
jgi:hypothetical protein